MNTKRTDVVWNTSCKDRLKYQHAKKVTKKVDHDLVAELHRNQRCRETRSILCIEESEQELFQFFSRVAVHGQVFQFLKGKKDILLLSSDPNADLNG